MHRRNCNLNQLIIARVLLPCKIVKTDKKKWRVVEWRLGAIHTKSTLISVRKFVSDISISVQGIDNSARLSQLRSKRELNLY